MEIQAPCKGTLVYHKPIMESPVIYHKSVTKSQVIYHKSVMGSKISFVVYFNISRSPYYFKLTENTSLCLHM